MFYDYCEGYYQEFGIIKNVKEKFQNMDPEKKRKLKRAALIGAGILGAGTIGALAYKTKSLSDKNSWKQSQLNELADRYELTEAQRIGDPEYIDMVKKHSSQGGANGMFRLQHKDSIREALSDRGYTIEDPEYLQAMKYADPVFTDKDFEYVFNLKRRK